MDSAIEEIRRAFHDDSASEVRRLLAVHAQLRALVKEPIGPFDSPAICGVKSREMLDVLLDAGADINARSKWWAGGFGLLDSASPELSAYALTRGAKLTPHAAARLGMVDELRQMIVADEGVVRQRGGDGHLPLHFASTVEVAELLLENGADIDARDIDHESTAAQWMLDERQEVARYLASRGCETDLLMAAALGDIDLAGRILDDDPDAIRLAVDADHFPMSDPRAGGTIYQWTLGWGVRAHQVARKHGHSQMVEFLTGRSPAAVKLVDACWRGDELAVKTLASEGAAQTLTDEDKRQICYAARNDEAEVVRLMLLAGLPENESGPDGATPLHWAGWNGNAEMARAILPHNPPLDVRDAEHHAMPIGWAIYGSEHGWHRATGDYAGTVDALLDAGAELPPEPVGSAEVRELLKRHGVS
jgi:ankyrin repeat protein